MIMLARPKLSPPHRCVVCPPQTIPPRISPCLPDSVANSRFSNRLKHGLEFGPTRCKQRRKYFLIATNLGACGTHVYLKFSPPTIHHQCLPGSLQCHSSCKTCTRMAFLCVSAALRPMLRGSGFSHFMNHGLRVTSRSPRLLQYSVFTSTVFSPEAHMAEIQPFRAFRYDTQRVALQDVLTQPYDKITPAMQEQYYAASPYNLISVEKGRVSTGDTPQSNVYTCAAKKIEEWIAEKILVQDAAPNLCVYSQEFTVPGSGAHRVRLGFIALVRLEDYDEHVVFRHERTLSGPKADRIELLNQTRVQTGQLFLLYDDAAKKIDALLESASRGPAPFELADEYGVTHRLWPVAEASWIARVQQEMAEKKLVIADGH